MKRAKRTGGFTAVWKYFTRGYKEDRDMFFLSMHKDRKEATCRRQTKRKSDQGLGKIIYHEGDETLAEDPWKAVTP